MPERTFPVFHNVAIPDTRDAALRYYDTYVKHARAYFNRVWPNSNYQPYTRADYIKEITAFFGERTDKIDWPAFKTGQGRD